MINGGVCDEKELIKINNLTFKVKNKIKVLINFNCMPSISVNIIWTFLAISR